MVSSLLEWIVIASSVALAIIGFLVLTLNVVKTGYVRTYLALWQSPQNSGSWMVSYYSFFFFFFFSWKDSVKVKWMLPVTPGR